MDSSEVNCSAPPCTALKFTAVYYTTINCTKLHCIEINGMIKHDRQVCILSFNHKLINVYLARIVFSSCEIVLIHQEIKDKIFLQSRKVKVMIILILRVESELQKMSSLSFAKLNFFLLQIFRHYSTKKKYL